MHGHDENMLFWSQFKFGITIQLQFLEYFFLILFIILAIKKKKKKKKNKRNYSTLFYDNKSLEFFIFVSKLKKEPFYCSSWKFYTKKIEK